MCCLDVCLHRFVFILRIVNYTFYEIYVVFYL